MSKQESTHVVSFSPFRLARLSSFRIGSAMVEILATSIWNRIMISTLGMSAGAVGFLLALRYLLAPLSVWIGHRSDTVTLWGYYRTSYIWLGRAITVMCLPLLGVSVMLLEQDQGSVAGWGIATVCFVFYAMGSLLTGSPYLALVRDSAPKERQGLSISVSETAFIIFIAIAGVVFSIWMQTYSARVFWQMLIACMVAGAVFWFISILGVENASIPPAVRAQTLLDGARQTDFMATFKKIWGDSRTRIFFFFLALSTFAAWSQDTILEPFGAEVLDLPISTTTRFNSYWQGATVLTLVASAIIWRKRPPERQTGLAGWGLIVMGAGMGLIAFEAFSSSSSLMTLALVIFGGGFGVYTFGSLNLMAVMASDQDAGAYLGLWTISILIFKGLGTFLGGVSRDVLLWSFDGSQAYGFTFLAAAVGLWGAVAILMRLDIVGFARDMGRLSIDVDNEHPLGVDV